MENKYLVTSYQVIDKENVIKLIHDSDMTCGDNLPPVAFVAIMLGNIIGYVAGHVKYEQNANVDILVVDKNYRTLGIGKALLYKIFNHFKRRGVINISAYVNTDNDLAIKLYASIGINVTKKVFLMEENVDNLLDKLKDSSEEDI